MLSPRAGLKQLEFPSAGRPMSSRSWRSTECLIWKGSREGNNPENQNLAVWFCVRPGPTPFLAFGTPARFRVTGAASCGHYAAGAAGGKKTVANHH